jgi:hypothetical protein
MPVAIKNREQTTETELELTKAKEKKELASQGTGSEELEQIHQELQLTGTRLELKFVAEPTATRKSGKKPSHRASQRTEKIKARIRPRNS